MASANSTNETTYNVLLTGHLLAGVDRVRAVKSLAKFLNANPSQAQGLLQGRAKVIKKNIDKNQALKYKQLLVSHGIAVEVRKVGQAGQQAPATKSPATKAPAEKASKDKVPKEKVGAQVKKPVKTPLAIVPDKVTHISEAAKRKGKKLKSVIKAAIPGNPAATKKDRMSKKPTEEDYKTQTQDKNQDSNIFNGMLQCKPVTMLQQLSLVASCSALVMLAAFYAGIFITSGFFALERLFSFLFLNQASSFVTATFIYLLPCLLATLICVLMLRPVLAKKMKAERLELSAKNERNLLNFVKQIATMVGSPKPEDVLITDEFEAVAEFKPGLQALKEGRIQLRIGLPLLMVLDIPALGGKVASSLAHFDDKTGMYMLKVIRELNSRLENAYQNRDNWQDVLDNMAQSKRAFFSRFLTRLYQPLLTLSSWFSLPFLFLVRVVSAATSRGQSFRSDNYFCAVAGTRKFVEHFSLLYKSRYAYAEAEDSLRAGVESHKFVNDLPALLLHSYKNLPHKINAEVADAIVEHSTRWNDLQPCNRDRMITAEEEDYLGIVELKAEAWRLLQDLKGTSRRFTLAYYKMHDYGVDEKSLVDARELATSSNEERVRDEICNQFYNGWFEPNLFWQTNQFAYARSISKQQRIVEINESIKMLRRSSPDFISLKNEVSDKFERYAYSRFAVEIHKAGYRLDNDIPNLDGVTAGELAAYNNEQRREYESRRAQQRDLCRVMGERLCFALAFLSDERECKIAEVVLSILSVLEAQASQLDALRAAVFLVPHYRSRIKNKNETEHSRRLRRLTREIITAHDLCMAEFKRYRWPFGNQYHSLADYVAKFLPKVDSTADADPKTQSTSAVLDSRVNLYDALWQAIMQANRFLNGKIAPLAQKAELENNIARIKMTVSGKQVG